MKTGKKEVRVFSTELFLAVGLDNKIQDAFKNIARFESSVSGHTLSGFTQLIETTTKEFETRTKAVFNSEVEKGMINFYSPIEGALIPGYGKLVEDQKSNFEFTMSQGSLGMEFTHVVNFRGSKIGVDYDGVLSRTKDGFSYIEVERSWSGAFTKGPVSIVKQDALVVRFNY
jgi:hypothetical protein